VILISTGVALIGAGMVLIISGVIGLMLENSQRSCNCGSARFTMRHRHRPICSLGRAAIWFDRFDTRRFGLNREDLKWANRHIPVPIRTIDDGQYSKPTIKRGSELFGSSELSLTLCRDELD
jgi:hypothetical protein